MRPGAWVGMAAAVLLATAGCAKQGYPTGGPKDVRPPQTVGSKPPSESRNFDRQQFYIEFDEYVVLKNADQNVLVSPPMKHKPEYTVKGKRVVVKLNDTLQPQTTYLFQFKEAVADYTEGNVLPSCEYVFSTGGQMDTMMMVGTVSNARDGKAWGETLTVVACREGDTVPSLVTRTDKEGNFAFHYIPAGNYRLTAIEDRNRDLRVDDAEAVAWDTTLYAAADSVDSAHMVRLRISAPERKVQRIMKSEFEEKGRIVISTAAPLVHPTVSGEKAEWRLNAGRDTLTVWCLNAECDSTVLVVADEGLQDTLKLRYRPKRTRASRGGRGRNQQPEAEKKPLMHSLCTGTAAHYDDLRLGFRNPIAKVADSAVAEVMRLKDSSVVAAPLVLDSSGLEARIGATLHSGEKYTIRLREGLFTDLYGTASDSLRFDLTPRDYGTITLHVKNNTGEALVVELLDSRDTVVRVQPVPDDGTVSLTHVDAGQYRVRAVYDSDGNGRWTTGDYRLGRQPERTRLFGKTLNVREKWELEERWTIGIKQGQRQTNPNIPHPVRGQRKKQNP